MNYGKPYMILFVAQGYHNPGDYRNASFQYRCFLQTRSYPGSKAIQKEETFLSELTNQSKGSQSNCLFLYVEPQLY